MNPRLPRTRSALLLLLAFSLAALAGDVWKNKPPSEWTTEETIQFLTDSPWARRITVYHPFNLEVIARRPKSLPRPSPDLSRDDGSLWQLEARGLATASAIYVVRWSSAKIVQQAFEALTENPALRDIHSAPPELPADQYVVTVRVDRPPIRPVESLLEALTRQALLQGAELRTSGKLQMKPDRILRHGLGAGAAVSFLFPRELNGERTLSPQTQWAEFRFDDGRGGKLKARFDFDKMKVEQRGDD